MMKRIKRNLTGWLIVLTAGLFSAQPVSGHFVWVAKDAKTGEMKIYFGEGPEPDQKMFFFPRANPQCCYTTVPSTGLSG